MHGIFKKCDIWLKEQISPLTCICTKCIAIYETFANKHIFIFNPKQTRFRTSNAITLDNIWKNRCWKDTCHLMDFSAWVGHVLRGIARNVHGVLCVTVWAEYIYNSNTEWPNARWFVHPDMDTTVGCTTIRFGKIMSITIIKIIMNLPKPGK